MNLNEVALQPIEEGNENDIESAEKAKYNAANPKFKQKKQHSDIGHFIRSKLFIFTVAVCTFGVIILSVGFLINYEKENDLTLTVDVWKDELSEEQHIWYDKGLDELKIALSVKINTRRAKNVILFVADGMGPATATAARIYAHGEDGSLTWENFPHMGLLKTYCNDKQVPDSASTATALFGGVKINYETIGVDSFVHLGQCNETFDELHHVDSIIEWAQEADMATGFVTTARIMHGTPAALYSHVADRRWECEEKMPMEAKALGCKDIASQLVQNAPGRDINVIMGGGRQCLISGAVGTANDPIDEWSCQSKDGRNLLEDWKFDKRRRQLKHKLLNNNRDLLDLADEDVDYVLGVFANGHLSFEDQRDKSPLGMPSLTEMTTAALKVLLRNEKGFVLVVEGGMIDQAHHRGWARRALSETVEFDRAIAETVEIMRPYLDETLIIVTADHAHTLSINGYPDKGADILGFAGDSKFDGVPYTTLTYATGHFGYQVDVDETGNPHRHDPSKDNTSSFDYVQQVAIKTDENTHSGMDVAVHAMGPMAHLFHRVHEQSYVAHVIGYAARIGRFRDTTVANAILDVLGFT